MTEENFVPRVKIERIILGPAYDRRYLQDTPILPDVWLAYARDPSRTLGLILEPERNRRAGEVAVAIRDRLKDFRDKKRFLYEPGYKKGEDAEENKKHERVLAEIAHLPGVVVLRVYFDELIHVVLPYTLWWKKQKDKLSDLLLATDRKSKLPDKEQLDRLTKAFEFFKLDEKGKQERYKRCLEKFKLDTSSLDLFRFAHAAGLINLHIGGTTKKSRNTEKDLPKNGTGDEYQKVEGYSVRECAQSFLNLLYAFKPKKKTEDKHKDKIGSVFIISRNRDAEAAMDRSAVACKADAARLLFNVSCKNITWAVADSGISHRHPAFHSWREDTCGSRVIETYDFTRLRSLLSLDLKKDEREQKLEEILKKVKGAGMTAEEEKANEKMIARNSKKQIAELNRRIEEGYDNDWALLEPFIRLDQKDLKELPVSDHGTHVAGIISADWPNPDFENIDDRDAGNPRENLCSKKLNEQYLGDPDTKRITLSVNTSQIKHERVSDESMRKMIGMCPDIRLIDLRVLRREQDPSGRERSDEFEVIAALQFVRYLNNKAGQIKVHGVNLSLSIKHDLANYACGRTPICLECEEVVSSGVVVVAAAGNRGYQMGGQIQSNLGGRYQTVSITDPGNASKVITVGATHRYRPHEYGVSYFSSRGPTGDGRRKPDLVAPGEKINAPVRLTEEDSKDGTSMAAPHVSGAAAMLMARYPELIGKPERIKEILCNTATDLGREHYFQGSGMLDVLRALQSI